MTHALIWLRRDLRLADNPALQAALDNDLRPIPVYIHDTALPGGGAAGDWWLHHSLVALQQDLRSLGSDLLIVSGNSLEQLQSLAVAYRASHVFWNRRYEPDAAARDRTVKEALRTAGLVVESHTGSLLREPWQLAKQDGTPYRVFTPYWRKGCLEHGRAPREPLPAPADFTTCDTAPDLGPEQETLLPAFPWFENSSSTWEPGEAGALKRLDAFLADSIGKYDTGRDRPDLEHVSRLSPHLHFGEVSPI